MKEGYFNPLRHSHPVKLGDIIDGKRVVETFYKYVDGKHIPYYRLEGSYKKYKYETPD